MERSDTVKNDIQVQYFTITTFYYMKTGCCKNDKTLLYLHYRTKKALKKHENMGLCLYIIDHKKKSLFRLYI